MGATKIQFLRADPSLRLTPVVVLTTSNREEELQVAYNLNVAGYLVKPLTYAAFADLMATLSRYWTLCELP